MIHVWHINQLGTDKTVVDAARVSYGSATSEENQITPNDAKLINYLAAHNHMSPFRHCFLQLKIKCSEMVARQLYKHVVGIECTATSALKDHAWNEISGRYVMLDTTDFWAPDLWRSAPGKGQSKQGSGAPVGGEAQEEAFRLYAEAMQQCRRSYESMLELGVCKEQARCVLPMAFTTEFYWTASLQALVNVIKLRSSPDAQFEIQEISNEIEKLVRQAFPVSAAALLD